MTTQADYDFMKAVWDEMNKEPYRLQPFNPHKKKALTQVRTRLLTINLNLRPELPLPQELIDKIYREALFSELKEKIPKFKTGWAWMSGGNIPIYHPVKVFKNIWIDLLDQLVLCPKNRIIYINHQEVNKKEYLIKVLNENGVKCDKRWTVKELIKLL